MAAEYRALIRALEAIEAIENEIDAGTKHFIDGKECDDPWKILRALIEKRDVTVEFHCVRCGALVEDFLPIEKRYCKKCRSEASEE